MKSGSLPALRSLHPVVREWALLLVALLLLAFALPGSTLFWRVDQTLYDESLRLTRTPVHPDIVVIAIDDNSLARIGRWPWRRTVHAALLDRLATANTKGVFLDIMFAEADPDPTQDTLLASAIARHGKVVLPVSLDITEGVRRARSATPVVRDAARSLGHINATLDPDGSLRRVPLAAGIGEPNIPHATRTLVDIASGNHDGPAPTWVSESAYSKLVYADLLLIPFTSAPLSIVSYADVLSGQVPASTFTNRYVLVGLTGAGTGDTFVTPLSGDRMLPMPGIEIHAQILNAALSNTRVAAATPMQTATLTAIVMIALLTVYLTAKARVALLATFVFALAVLLCAFVVMFTLGWWVSPIYAIVLIFSAYPLWGWRRLEAAQKYMREEVARLAEEPDILPPLLVPPAPLRGSQAVDDVERSIEEVRRATERLRNLKRFISDSFEQLPDAVLVADREARIVMANDRAALYLETALPGALVGDDLTRVLARAVVGEEIDWQERLAPALQRGASFECEGATGSGRQLWIRVGAAYSARAQQSGVIVGLTDVSALRAAEARRDEVLKVMTHDMRAPQASILTLIEMHRADPSAITAESLIERAGRYAERTLALADGFLKLAKAEELDPATMPVINLVDVVLDAADGMWPLAAAKRIRLHKDIEHDEVIIRGDFDLLARAFANLIGNAIKYSEPATCITLRLRPSADKVIVSVADQGFGIPPHAMSKLFTRFGRIGETNTAKEDGVGLGLVMVKSFIAAHGGDIEVTSSVAPNNHGSVFTVTLPAAAIKDAAAPPEAGQDHRPSGTPQVFR
jgi:CHASE2 domain-containing sensor protein/signal transduction histidine kinase